MTEPELEAAGEQVLVVDDEPVVLEVLTKALAKVGLVVKTAPDAETAWPWLDELQFAAVLTDKNLPGKSGLDLLREVAVKQPYCARLVMTAYSSPDSVLEALRLGANDYLEKPFPDLGLVTQKVKSALANARTQLEREALVQSLKATENSLRSKDQELFQHRTEVDRLATVLDLKVEQAVRVAAEEVVRLRTENAGLRAELEALRRELGDREEKTDQHESIVTDSNPSETLDEEPT